MFGASSRSAATIVQPRQLPRTMLEYAAAVSGCLPVGCVALLTSFHGEMSLTHGYFLWNAFHAFVYCDFDGPLHFLPGQTCPRLCSNETNGRMPCARAACSLASRRSGSVLTAFQGETRRAYRSFRIWKFSSSKVAWLLSEIPIAGSLP